MEDVKSKKTEPKRHAFRISRPTNQSSRISTDEKSIQRILLQNRIQAIFKRDKITVPSRLPSEALPTKDQDVSAVVFLAPHTPHTPHGQCAARAPRGRRGQRREDRSKKSSPGTGQPPVTSRDGRCQVKELLFLWG